MLTKVNSHIVLACSIYFQLHAVIVSGHVLKIKTRPDYDLNLRQNIPQEITLYDLVNNEGNFVKANNYIRDLSIYNMTNKASSARVNGIWILYDNVDYNTANLNSISTWVWGENKMINFNSGFDNLASSIRLTGAPDGYQYDTINFYEGKNFNGNEEYSYQDITAMQNKQIATMSIIVSGCEPWTVYENEFYDGNSCCIYPSDQENCFPGFYPNGVEMDGFGSQISSTRKGCFSSLDCE